MTRYRKFQKNSKKIQKIKIPLLPHFKPKLVGNDQERENIKKIVTFRSYPNRNRKFQKSSKKIKKIPLWLLFKPKLVGKD